MGFLETQNFLNGFLVVNELTNFPLGLIFVTRLNAQDPHKFFFSCAVKEWKITNCPNSGTGSTSKGKKNDVQVIGNTINNIQ